MDVAGLSGFLYFLIHSPEDNFLLQLDRATGVCQVLPDTGFAQIEPYTQDTLLVSFDGALHRYDPRTRTRSDALAAVDPQSGAFAYDQERDCLFYVRNGDVYYKEKDKPEALLRITEIQRENPSWEEDVPDVYGQAPVSFVMPLPDGSVATTPANCPMNARSTA